jgi:GNAT superfamily N-acetyltransferase
MTPKVRRLNRHDWQAFKEIRLEALTVDPGKFGGRLALEQNFSSASWRYWLDSSSGAIFGLFMNNVLIGTACVVTWQESILKIEQANGWSVAMPGQNTAFCIGSYIKKSYRGSGLSRPLHYAELRWIADNQDYCRAVTAYRASNSTTKSITEHFGFQLVETKPYDWPDGVTEDIVICSIARTDLQKALHQKQLTQKV